MKKSPNKRLQRFLCTGLILAVILSSLVIISVTAEDQQTSPSAGTSSGTITIGDTTFSSEANVTSGWNTETGTGWKNLAGQYVTLLNYDGTGEEISMDSGVLTLAVAGVNRIGTLKGNCSVNILGTGIVLIDNIELGAGQTLSLMPNTALYQTGSAAVFLKEGNEYRLINGDIPGILDEDYFLDGVNLRIPEDSSIILNAFGIRKEFYYSYDADDYVTDIDLYKNFVSWEDLNAVHDGQVTLEGVVARLVLGKEGTLTIDDGATVRVEQITTNALGIDFEPVASALVIYGDLNNNGIIEGGFVDEKTGEVTVGGFVDVNNGGNLYGTGTILSSDVTLNAGGNLSESILLDTSGLTITGDDMTVSAQIKDSAIYLKAKGIFLSELLVSGTSWVGTDSGGAGLGTYYQSCKIGDITSTSGGSLEIVCNDHIYMPNHNSGARYVEDTYLTISGTITGCTVSALAGCVEYSGTGKTTLPVTPSGYVSRVYISSFDIQSTDYPLNMSKLDGTERAKADLIPVMYGSVRDTLVSDRVLARKWVVQDIAFMKNSLKREKNQSFTCASFLQKYNLQGKMDEFGICTAVELIHSDLSRIIYFYGDENEFSTEDVILIRVLDCSGVGGQGGSSVSHTETNFSGAGTLGGTVDGSATTGNGKVVYTSDKTEPPTETPTETPTEKPTEPSTEKPTEKPTEPSTEKPTEKPTEPSTKETETKAEKENKTDKETEGRKTSSVNTGSTTSGNNTGQSGRETYVAGTLGNTRVLIEDVTYSSANTNTPIYRTMSVQSGNKKITNLSEKITVETALSAGETYGANLYAVFVDENEKLKVFPATYDEKEKKCRFEADVTGNYVFVQLDAAPLSEDELIEACRASDEVKILIMIMRLYAFWG